MRYVSIDIETLGLDPDTCDTIEFGSVLDDLSECKPLESLPTFHCYLTRPDNIYKGEVYAMYMHSKSKIFERIAKREEGFTYTPFDMLDEVFAGWLNEHGIGDLGSQDKITLAGKNFQSFDMRFLRAIGFGEKTKLHHRTLDPGSMWFDPANDEEIPNLKTCLERAGVRKEVEHTAVEDAMDVVRCIRAKHVNEQARKLFSGFKVFERLQDEGPFEAGHFDELDQAVAYAKDRREGPLGTSSVFSVVGPDGEMLTHQEIESKQR